MKLIDGQLIVGDSLTGGRLLLRQLLRGWSAVAAIALAPIETWLEALAAAYDVSLPVNELWDLQIKCLEIRHC